MKRAFYAVLLLVLQVFGQSNSGLLYHQASLAEIDADIRCTSRNLKSVQEKMVYFSARFLGAPYALTCEAEGLNGRYETEPLLNLKQLNCMTYCEIVMALSLSDYYEEMFNVLQHIRYRDGIISMATRNHYTMADWHAANQWCLKDVSVLVGGPDAVKLTRTISHEKFFAGKGIQDIPVLLPDRTVTIDYIPLARLALHEFELQSGDVVALIQNREGIFSAHMLLIIKNNGRIFFRHASMSAGKVLDQDFDEYIRELAKKPRYLGMSFMRMRDEVQWQGPAHYHGKFRLQP